MDLAELFSFKTPPELASGQVQRHRIAIVGAGPVGLALAIDLAQNGQQVLLLDDDAALSTGSRAICFAKRTLEVLDRLHCGDAAVNKGITWNLGKVFFGAEQLYTFNLLPQSRHKRPAFINLQQYHLERMLVERLHGLDKVDARWQNKVSAVRPQADHVALTVDTPQGSYDTECDWLIACDGARSPVRTMLGLESHGQVFRDRFLIADVKMHAEFPTERRFWFDPPFHPHQSVLLHKQPDDIWRIDFQLGWDADPEQEKKPENVIPRIKAMLGEERGFSLEWVSVYSFQCRRMDKFRHGRVVFAGDAAHQVSPFGARGANSGIQDADNLGWKLRLVVNGQAPQRLIDSYDDERCYAADENIKNSTRSTDFITPKSKVSRAFRDATLKLARDYAFARPLVNSGRLSLPTQLSNSWLNTPDADQFDTALQPGSPALDAPLLKQGRPAWWLDQLGDDFKLALFSTSGAVAPELVSALAALPLPVRLLVVSAAPAALPPQAVLLVDAEGLLRSRYDGQDGTLYLFRPDQHVAARFRAFNAEQLQAALLRATAQA